MPSRRKRPNASPLELSAPALPLASTLLAVTAAPFLASASRLMSLPTGGKPARHKVDSGGSISRSAEELRQLVLEILQLRR